MRAAAVVAALLCLAVIVAAGCGGSKKAASSESEGMKKTIAGLSANDHGTKQASGTTEVELDDYYFEPTIIKGKAGQKVTLELKNEGKTEHNFSIDAQHIDKDLEPGKSAMVTVTIPQSDEISFYCKYHKSRGMAGALQASG